MKFETFQLTEPLSDHIESIFHYQGFRPDHSIERVVPTGHLFLLFELDDIPRHTYDPDQLQVNGTFTKAWVSGMHQQYLSISAHQDSEMLVVQFKAHGAYPFFHQAIETWNDQVVPAQRIFGTEILELRDAIQGTDLLGSKFALIEQWLNQRYDIQKKPSTALLQVFSALQKEPAVNYPKIIADFPQTQKHLITQFKKYHGLTPKIYQRILRFNEILQQIQQKEQISWAQVAYQCGYSDQSHFIKEFKRFSGFNPQEFIKRDFHQSPPNFFPLDREG